MLNGLNPTFDVAVMLASGGVCIGDVSEVEFLFWKGDNGLYGASKGTW